MGFTLVELLVVIAIIGILVALLLPAVQAARAAARRSQCQSQLKQVGLACLNYESSNAHLPAGVEGKGRFNDDDNPGSKDEVGMAWGIAILPYLEEQPTFDQFDFSGNNHYRTGHSTSPQTANALAGTKRLGVYLCPEEESPLEPFPAHGVDWATSNYRAVSGIIDLPNQIPSTGFAFWDRLNRGGNQLRTDNRRFRGPIVAAGGRIEINPTRIAQVTDGTSKTAMVGEFHPGPDAIRRNAWASGWRYHSKGHFIRDGLVPSTIYRTATVSECSGSPRQIPPGLGGNVNLCVRSFSTNHPGGVIQFAFCDGSVRAIRDVVDEEIYLALGTIAGEEIVDEGS